MPATETRSPAAARPAAVRPPDLVVRGVSKTFRISQRPAHTLKERVLHPFEARNVTELRALRDISFEVAAGEFFGIVGRNGSGKSTLLKCLAGIYGIDGGDLTVRGRVSPFIELGVGFNPELTARDNVLINGVMLGLSRKQARERFDDVVAFAELEPFLDLKLKNYSSGMSVRLAFATAIQVDADVLLVDEVLAVGDASFQRKCFEEFERLKADGRTIVFVTHDMSAVERFCDRAMLIERGEMVELDEPSVVTRRYNELNFGRLLWERAETEAPTTTPPVEILSAWVEDSAGERVLALPQEAACGLCFETSFHERVEDPVFGVTLRNDARHTIFASSSRWDQGPSGVFVPGDRVVVRVELPLWLAPSRYTLSTAVTSSDGLRPLAVAEDLASLIVEGPWREGGVAALPHEFAVERA